MNNCDFFAFALLAAKKSRTCVVHKIEKINIVFLDECNSKYECACIQPFNDNKNGFSKIIKNTSIHNKCTFHQRSKSLKNAIHFNGFTSLRVNRQQRCTKMGSTMQTDTIVVIIVVDLICSTGCVQNVLNTLKCHFKCFSSKKNEEKKISLPCFMFVSVGGGCACANTFSF